MEQYHSRHRMLGVFIFLPRIFTPKEKAGSPSPAQQIKRFHQLFFSYAMAMRTLSYSRNNPLPLRGVLLRKSLGFQFG